MTGGGREEVGVQKGRKGGDFIFSQPTPSQAMRPLALSWPSRPLSATASASLLLAQLGQAAGQSLSEGNGAGHT